MLRSLLILILLLVALPSRAGAPTTTIDLWNTMVQDANVWVKMYQVRNPNEYNVTEERAFKRMCDDFNEFRKHVKLEYEQ